MCSFPLCGTHLIGGKSFGTETLTREYFENCQWQRNLSLNDTITCFLFLSMAWHLRVPQCTEDILKWFRGKINREVTDQTEIWESWCPSYVIVQSGLMFGKRGPFPIETVHIQRFLDLYSHSCETQRLCCAHSQSSGQHSPVLCFISQLWGLNLGFDIWAKHSATESEPCTMPF